MYTRQNNNINRNFNYLQQASVEEEPSQTKNSWLYVILGISGGGLLLFSIFKAVNYYKKKYIKNN
jgi:hypothetical protein